MPTARIGGREVRTGVGAVGVTAEEGRPSKNAELRSSDRKLINSKQYEKPPNGRINI